MQTVVCKEGRRTWPSSYYGRWTARTRTSAEGDPAVSFVRLRVTPEPAVRVRLIHILAAMGMTPEMRRLRVANHDSYVRSPPLCTASGWPWSTCPENQGDAEDWRTLVLVKAQARGGCGGRERWARLRARLGLAWWVEEVDEKLKIAFIRTRECRQVSDEPPLGRQGEGGSSMRWVRRRLDGVGGKAAAGGVSRRWWS